VSFRFAPAHLRNYSMNPAVSPAAAQIPGEAVRDLRIASLRILVQKGLRRHREPRRAEPALLRVIIDERGLHRMRPLASAKPFRGHNLLALSFDRQYRARIHCAPIDQYRASAAFRAIAHAFGPGYVEMLA